MSSKINVVSIIKGHLKTLRNADSSISLVDCVVFFGFPIGLASLGLATSFDLSKEVVSLLVNFGAIFTALLLSVLVLVYDQENKYQDLIESGESESADNYVDIKKRILDELYYNISFSIVASVVLVLVCLLHAVVGGKCIDFEAIDITFRLELGVHILTPFALLLVSTVFLNLLMIVKRLHALLTNRGVV